MKRTVTWGVAILCCAVLLGLGGDWDTAPELPTLVAIEVDEYTTSSTRMLYRAWSDGTIEYQYYAGSDGWMGWRVVPEFYAE